MSELMCSQAKCRRKDEHIAELKAENEHLNTEINTKAEWNMRYFEQIEDLKAELADTVTECLADTVAERLAAKSNEDIMRKQLADLTVQNANMQENLIDLEAELAELKANSADAMNALMDEVHESKKNAAFFRCCALSGEVPKDGAEPHPKKEYEPPSKELLAALLQEKGG